MLPKLQILHFKCFPESQIYSVLNLLTGNFKSSESYDWNRGKGLAKYLVRDFEILVSTFLIRLVDKMNLLKIVFLEIPLC